MSLLVNFYRGESRDAEGRFLEEILTWDDDEMEEVHSFFQWLFPLPETDGFLNQNAPLLNEKDIAEFKTDPVLRGNLRKSFKRILSFLGLAMANGKVVVGPNFSLSVPEVWAAPNHNWIRIARILRSLTLLGLKSEAEAMFAMLEAIYSSRRFPITVVTFDYWNTAFAVLDEFRENCQNQETPCGKYFLTPSDSATLPVPTNSRRTFINGWSRAAWKEPRKRG